MIALAVHGGAWDIPDELVEPHREGLQRSLNAGWTALLRGGTAVDAVEAAIVTMEDDEAFDAGRGSFINQAGEVELDASIMDGRTMRAGAVAGVQNIRNPIRLARKIMDESEHVLLAGMGAVRFAREHGLSTCSQDDLITDRELQRWRETQRRGGGSVKDAFRRKKVPADTVGAVALDAAGDFASGTSTGGVPNKYPGRVGDSPLIGCGTYAENGLGGVSTTGWGEAMIRVVMAKSVLDTLERNQAGPQAAAEEGIRMLERKVQGFGGVVVLGRSGAVGLAFNTPRMARGYMTAAMDTPVVLV